MEQLTQNLKNGTMQLLEVPYPALLKGCVLIRNHYSLISPGTESKTVKDARLNIVSKASARKEEVKKVIEAARTFGLKDTYRMVMNRLDAPSALGYSCAGEVIAVADDVSGFKIGDNVACGGNTANHAEVVAVPKNLCVKVDAAVSLREASYTTLGAIAMQGVRQADLKLGESGVVIGLGLIGQLTLQLLEASGIKAIGIDVDLKRVELANNRGGMAFERSKENLSQLVHEYTNGLGADAVIIAASTSSADPVDLAGELCRQKGKVIIVGAVSTDFKRSNYFKKELDLRMSCSYGPGRYDADYEEKGMDYPVGYVRWTENRNMQAFLELVKGKKIDTERLTTHTFNFHEAPRAYQLILDGKENFSGVVLKYDTGKELRKTVRPEEKKFDPDNKVNVGLIGAGSFAQAFLLPVITTGNANLVAIATAKTTNARNIAGKYGFSYCTGDANEILTDSKVNTVIIATRHDSHAKYVIQALENGKNVYVEKPLCLNIEELEQIKNNYEKANVHLMIGFNRRFAPHVVKLKSLLTPDNRPVAVNYRINAGSVPLSHWTQDKQAGGGRIIGEVCHFIDLVTYIAGSKVKSVSANAMKSEDEADDTLTINLSFENGSIATVSYFANGSKKMGKEYIEVFSSGQVFVIDDFKTMMIYGKSASKSKLTNRDKGHVPEIKTFLDAVASGKNTPIPFEEIYHSTLVTFKVVESIAVCNTVVI